MEALNYTLTIGTVLFESNDPEVLIKGTVHKGHLKYDAELLINHSQLNRVVSQLQKQNTDFDFTAHLQSEKMDNNEILYRAILPAQIERQIAISSLSHPESIKQIRA